MKLGAFRASGPDRGLYQFLRAYWFTALATPQVSLNIRVIGAFHSNRPFLSYSAVQTVYGLSRLFCLLYPCQRADD